MITTRGRPGDPVQLDPFQNVKEIHWPNANIGVLALEYSMQGTTHPTFTVTDFPKNGSVNPWQARVKIAAGTSPFVANPVTAEMLANLYVWDAQFHKAGPNADKQMIGRALLFLNIPKIKAAKNPDGDTFSFTFRAPAGQFTTQSIIYTRYLCTATFQLGPGMSGNAGGELLVDSAGNWFWDQDASIQAFEGAGTGGLSAALEETGGNSWSWTTTNLGTETVDTDVSDALHWSANLYMYKKRKNFPVNAECTPGWSLSGVPELKGGAGDARTQGAPPATLPATNVRFTINTRNYTASTQRV